MESHKDVILSRAPAMYDKVGQVPTISLENYKGILLCARPVNLPHGASSQLRGETGGIHVLTANGEPAPAFVPAGSTAKEAGLGPSMEDRALMERNHRKRLENYKLTHATASTVLTRHKRWLRSFARQVRKMKDEEIEREIELARRAGRLRQQEEKRVGVVPPPSHEEFLMTPSAMMQPQSKPCGAADRVNSTSQANNGPKKASKKTTEKKKKKPKWALTEDEALEDELAEANDLVEFAKNLDYEKFISDYEVAGALAIMRERVEEIAKENKWSKEDVERAAEESVGDEMEIEEYEAEVAAEENNGPHQERKRVKQRSSTPIARKVAAGGAAEHAKAWDSSNDIGGVLRRAIFRDTLLLAERILDSSPSMQKIHTKFSLARVLQHCVLSGGNAAEALLNPLPTYKRGGMTKPRVVKVHPDATGLENDDGEGESSSKRILLQMQRSKERTQGLPYLYRCPAI